jgi:hypothetical protein
VIVLAAEFYHQGALPGELSVEQDLLWQTAEVSVRAAMTGKLSPSGQVQLLLALQGGNGVLGWQGVAGTLDPSVRGPLAYVLGHRYLRVLNRPAKEAVPFFRTARDDAPPDSPLRRLAQAELDRLKTK